MSLTIDNKNTETDIFQFLSSTQKKNTDYPSPKNSLFEEIIDNFYCEAGKKNLPILLSELKTQKDPTKFKNILLKCIQLYFDGLITSKASPNHFPQQKETLNTMLAGLEMTLKGYYKENKNIPIPEINQLLTPHQQSILKHGSKDYAKVRHLSEKEKFIYRYINHTINELKKEKIDLIIPIASGGFEPAILTANYLGINNILPLRYSIMGKNEKNISLPSYTPQDYPQKQIQGKNILIVDDVIASGSTAKKMINWTKQFNPQQIYFSVILNYSLNKKLPRSGIHSHNNSEHLFHS